MIDRIKVTEYSKCTKRTSKKKYSQILLLHPWYNMISGQNHCRKNSSHQITEKTLLYRWKIPCQTHTHIHTRKEKRRQNDHDHSLYIIFLFHMISPYLSLFQCFYHNTIPEEDTIEILCNCSQITIVFVNFSFCKIIYSDFDIFRL